MSKQHCRMLQVDCRTILSTKSALLRHCCRFLKFRPFDKVETNWTSSICFDFVERTKFHEKLVRHCCHERQQCRSNFRLCRSKIWLCRKNRSTCNIRQYCFDIHCCWCGRNFTVKAETHGPTWRANMMARHDGRYTGQHHRHDGPS